jgi:hypothetical protein
VAIVGPAFAPWCNGSTPRSGRGSWGSNPWGAALQTWCPQGPLTSRAQALSAHFRDGLDEVDLHAGSPTALDVAWWSERATVELRAGLVECERLGAERPAIVLGPLDDALSERLAAEPKLRERLVVYDLAALA